MMGTDICLDVLPSQIDDDTCAWCLCRTLLFVDRELQTVEVLAPVSASVNGNEFTRMISSVAAVTDAQGAQRRSSATCLSGNTAQYLEIVNSVKVSKLLINRQTLRIRVLGVSIRY